MTGLELRELRKKFNLSRINFAGLLKISIHTLDAWEGGKRNIPAPKIEYIKMVTKKYASINLKVVDGVLLLSKGFNYTSCIFCFFELHLYTCSS